MLHVAFDVLLVWAQFLHSMRTGAPIGFCVGLVTLCGVYGRSTTTTAHPTSHNSIEVGCVKLGYPQQYLGGAGNRVIMYSRYPDPGLLLQDMRWLSTANFRGLF